MLIDFHQELYAFKYEYFENLNVKLFFFKFWGFNKNDKKTKTTFSKGIKIKFLNFLERTSTHKQMWQSLDTNSTNTLGTTLD